MLGAGGSLFDNDKSSIDKMQNSLKSTVFEIVYYLVGAGKFPISVNIIFVMIESFQVLYFLFADEVN